MHIYSFPTLIYSGAGALDHVDQWISNKALKKILLVTDKNLIATGIIQPLLAAIKAAEVVIFDDTHPNPIEADVERGVEAFKENHCDGILAIGGGSSIDVAKVIKLMSSHPQPLSQYDDALGGDKLIVNPMPPLIAIPTTAGTGSEVGRSGVIIMRDTQVKTIFFAPSLMPDVAFLIPTLTTCLPKHLTAATGLDAFTHCLEAYFAPGFHPMADGIALEGIKLILENLITACDNPQNLAAREAMLIAASMGATAFQKGLGMIHSLAHPLSSQKQIHHGLANALILPSAIRFLENKNLNKEQQERLQTITTIMKNYGYNEPTLSQACASFIKATGIQLGLQHHNIANHDLEALTREAFTDTCHKTNMIPVDSTDLLNVYQMALT